MPSKSPRSLRLALLLLSGSALAGVPFVTAAQAGNWTGATSTDWFTNTNWDTNAVPTNADDTVIDTTTVNSTIIDTNAASASTLTVGESGTGSLVITGGGSLQSGTVTLGDATGSSGGITVENGSNLVATTLNIGVAGSADFTVQNGGSVLDGAALVGSTHGIASATLDGATSTWNSNDLVVGASSSQGSVTVQNGGTLISVTGEVGQLLGTGTVTLTDTGSQWSVDTLVVGEDGTGTVTVENGATLSGTTLTIAGNPGTVHAPGTGTLAISTGGVVTTTGVAEIGQYAGYNGSVTVDGAGSSWQLGGNMIVGDQGGTGSVSITNRGTVDGLIAYLGNTAGSSGTITVDGNGSSLTTTGDIIVGVGGAGNLQLRNGATIADGGNFGLADQAGGGGTVTVDGAGSSLAVATNVIVGVFGNGAMTISNSATVSSADGVVGSGAGAVGIVTVTDSGSAITGTDDYTVGAAGTGTLALQNGGQAAVGHDFFIGRLVGGVGIVTVDGPSSEIFATNFLEIGGDEANSSGGNGTLTITNGGTADASFIEISVTPGATGVVTVDGANSRLLTPNDVTVGDFGSGTLTVSHGGLINASELVAGNQPDSSGSITITDAGSNVQVADLVVIGSGGTGSLSVLNGGMLSDDRAFIGGGPGSGTALVDGAGSTWSTVNDLVIGQGVNGALTISNGGTVTAEEAIVGEITGGAGTVTVTGAGSSWTVSDELLAGVAGGSSTLMIQNGGLVSVAQVTYFGVDDGTGALTVDGAGSQFNGGGNVYVGGDTSSLGGAGSITVTNGGSVNAPVSLFLGASTGSTGTVTVDGAGSSVTVGGVLGVAYAGAGTLIVRNGGALSTTLLDDGGIPGANGDVTITGAGSTITVANQAEIGDAGNGRLTLQNGGTLFAHGGTYVAFNPGSSGEIDIGAAPGSAATAPGTLSTASLSFGSGTGTLNFNHTSANYTFGGAINGAGTINQVAGTTFLSADSSGFTGATNVSGGALHVNGSLKNSAVTVMNSGTLAGNGTVGTVAAQAGGTVAPGNSIGTLTVNGNYNQASGSTYQAQIASNGQADLLNISGAATIANGALLSVVKSDAGPYLPGTQYTVLTAAGGVSGTFTVVGDAAQTAFTSLGAAYDANDVYLRVVKTASFTAAGATPNQRAAAGGADSLPPGNALYQAILGLPSNSAAQGAFDAISGEIHASIRTAALEDSRFVREAAVDRLRDADGERGIWAKGFGDWGVNATDGNAAKLSRSTGGILAGADGVFGTWRAGVLAGYSHSDTDVAARASSGDSDNYHLGVYGGTAQGPLGIRFGAAYSWQDIAVSRNAGFAGFSDKLASSYDAGTAQVFGDIGYRIQTPSLALEPFADLAYVNLDSGAFSESGGVSALAGHGQTSDATFTTLGARGSMGVNLGAALATAHGSLGWRHAFGDITPRSSFAFSGSTAFTIAGVPLAEDAAAIEAGIDMAVSDHASVGLSYSGQLSQRAEDHGVQAMANWKF